MDLFKIINGHLGNNIPGGCPPWAVTAMFGAIAIWLNSSKGVVVRCEHCEMNSGVEAPNPEVVLDRMHLHLDGVGRVEAERVMLNSCIMVRLRCADNGDDVSWSYIAAENSVAPSFKSPCRCDW